jgi:hypothetical protein
MPIVIIFKKHGILSIHSVPIVSNLVSHILFHSFVLGPYQNNLYQILQIWSPSQATYSSTVVRLVCYFELYNMLQIWPSINIVEKKKKMERFRGLNFVEDFNLADVSKDLILILCSHGKQFYCMIILCCLISLVKENDAT